MRASSRRSPSRRFSRSSRPHVVGRSRDQPRPLRQRVPSRQGRRSRRKSGSRRSPRSARHHRHRARRPLRKGSTSPSWSASPSQLRPVGNFPVLLLSMLWKGLTTRGAFIGGFAGLISAVVLTIYSPGIWEAVFGNPKGSALVPLRRRLCSPCRWRSSAAGSFRSSTILIAPRRSGRRSTPSMCDRRRASGRRARLRTDAATKDEKMGVRPSGCGRPFSPPARRPAPPWQFIGGLRKATLDLSIQVARIRCGRSGAQ